MVSDQDVLKALQSVPGPDGKTPLPGSGALSGLSIKDGKVYLSIAIDPRQSAALEPMRAAAEAAERQHQLVEAQSAQIKAAERQISMAKEQAFSEIRGIAIDVARSLTEKLSGADAGEPSIAAAVDRAVAERAG